VKGIERLKNLPLPIVSLHRNDDHWTLEEQLNGEQDPTQVGAALKALGITPIFALTPQAR